MGALQIVAIGLISTILAVIVRRSIGSEFAIFISLATGILIFFIIFDKLVYVVETLNQLVRNTSIEFIYFSTILKIVGIAYIVEFGAQVSRDAGEEAIATKIEFGGKIIIMVLALPVLVALVELILKIIP